MVQRNLVNSILISILAMDAENKVISRLNVPTMKSKKMETSRKKREKIKRSTLHGMTMISHLQVL